jgi:hypothetical protein
MPSSKGEPTDPELREKIKEEVKNEEKGIHNHNATSSISATVISKLRLKFRWWQRQLVRLESG